VGVDDAHDERDQQTHQFAGGIVLQPADPAEKFRRDHRFAAGRHLRRDRRIWARATHGSGSVRLLLDGSRIIGGE
jgi:hypothetical protein